jgi:hypothetical protein
MQEVLVKYQKARLQGNTMPLEQYEGYSCPVNDLFLSMVTKFFPFSFSHHAAQQRCKAISDRVVQHPFIIAGGPVHDGEVYPKPYILHPKHWQYTPISS